MRTLDELLRSIADDLVWRRKELTELRALIQTHKGQLKERVLIRSAVALLYAHWEGFVKRCGSNYLEFVSFQRIDCEKIGLNFLALAAKAKASEATKASDLASSVALADFYLSCTGKQAKVPYKKVLNTQSNLGSSVLKEILYVLGLEEKAFSTRLSFIDSNLVNPRNHVAHGEPVDLSVANYEELHDSVWALIESFRTEVENAAVQKSYLRVSPKA